jgi:thiazole synthase
MSKEQTLITGQQRSTDSWLTIRGRHFRSRLILGIEQYTSAKVIAEVLRSGRCDVFITTFDLRNSKPSIPLSELSDILEIDEFIWMGTTSFARTQEEALRTAYILRESLGIDVIKLDVRPIDSRPDNEQTVAAAKELIGQDFAVLPFIQPDADTATELATIGCSAVRVLASQVGSNRGIDDELAIRRVYDAVDIPVIIEGGLGSPAHVVSAMELGAAAVLVNTAVACAPDPVLMASSMRHAVLAGENFVAARQPATASGAGHG